MPPQGLPPLTAVIIQERFSDGTPAFVARCPELGVSSQGVSVDHARAMLQEAVEAWLEEATPAAAEEALSEGGRAVALMPLEITAPIPVEMAA